jgi:hypothetical protein
MPTAEAHVQTEHPSRYLTQLCKHARQVHRLRHRPPTHDGGDPQPPPKVQAPQTETDGIVSFSWGQCTLQASPYAQAPRRSHQRENLQQVQEIVARDIERFGKREHLKVAWQRPQAPTTQPGQAS